MKVQKQRRDSELMPVQYCGSHVTVMLAQVKVEGGEGEGTHSFVAKRPLPRATVDGLTSTPSFAEATLGSPLCMERDTTKPRTAVAKL